MIVVKAATWDTGTASGTPSGGSLTYTRQATAQPGGFNGYATIFTAVVSGSPGSMSVTLSAPAATCFHTMVVERWSGAQLAATPATNSTINGSGAPSATLTTTANNSIVTWVCTDNSSQDPTSRAYLSSATEDGLGDGHVNVDSVQYHAYQTASTAGSQTIGLSAPTGQTWVMCGIEVKAGVSAPTAVTWLFRA